METNPHFVLDLGNRQAALGALLPSGVAIGRLQATVLSSLGIQQPASSHNIVEYMVPAGLMLQLLSKLYHWSNLMDELTKGRTALH